MNLTDFSICIIAELSDRIFRFKYFGNFSSQLHVLNFSECLNAMPGFFFRSGRREKKG